MPIYRISNLITGRLMRELTAVGVRDAFDKLAMDGGFLDIAEAAARLPDRYGNLLCYQVLPRGWKCPDSRFW